MVGCDEKISSMDDETQSAIELTKDRLTVHRKVIEVRSSVHEICNRFADRLEEQTERSAAPFEGKELLTVVEWRIYRMRPM